VETRHDFVMLTRDGESVDSRSSCSSHADVLQEGQVAQQTALRWQRGCFQMYSKGKCDVADCPFLHDLNDDDICRLLEWKHGQQQHLIYVSDSNSNSQSQSRSSSAEGHATIAELLIEAEGLPPRGPERQQLLRKLRKQFKGVRDEQLAQQLPMDEFRRATSIGSLLHAAGQCNPCRNFVASRDCSEGLRCCFCHLPHEYAPTAVVGSAKKTGDAEAQSKQPGTRPCKSARDKYRRLAAKVEDRIRDDPFGWTPDSLDLPQQIFDGREDLKSKFMMRMSVTADKARSDLMRDVANASSSSAAAAGAAGSQPQASATTSEDLPVGRKGRRLVRL